MPSRYENFLLLADLKAELITTTVCEFCEIYNLKNKIKDKTCFKNPSAPTCKDLIITNQPRAFKHYMVIETGFSDFHKMCVTITLREKCPNTAFFLVVFSPNTGKYGQEKTPYLDTFHTVPWKLITNRSRLLSNIVNSMMYIMS